MSLRIGDTDFAPACRTNLRRGWRGALGKTRSMLSISLGLLASACATGVNYPGTAQPHCYDLVSLESEVLVQGVREPRCSSEPTSSAALSLFERLYPVHPLSPVRGVHEEPVTP